MMFGKKKTKIKDYDKENLQPVLRCSICNGEQVAGFKNTHSGQFEEVMFIRDEKDLDTFMKMYGLETITKEY
ncbi:MAG: aspartate dehydrogenase [Lachnospiraceae bacterium]|nr:aspartate dehydrogenase [Lachnospiraceae bacterium]